MHRFIPVGIIVAAMILAHPLVASCQTVRGISAPPAVAEWMDRGSEMHESLRPLEALEFFHRVLDHDPDHYLALWKSARASIALGLLASAEGVREKRYQDAEILARRAVQVSPDLPEGRVWLAVSLGRRAATQGARKGASHAQEARELAAALVESHPDQAGAHHVLGEWHAGIMRMGTLERLVARHLGGGSGFDEASWEGAEQHLLKAVALAPEILIHHLDLGRVFLDIGRPDDARNAFRQVLERPTLDPADPLHKQSAQELLKQLP